MGDLEKARQDREADLARLAELDDDQLDYLARVHELDDPLTDGLGFDDEGP